jgi:hypothetical protein
MVHTLNKYYKITVFLPMYWTGTILYYEHCSYLYSVVSDVFEAQNININGSLLLGNEVTPSCGKHGMPSESDLKINI